MADYPDELVENYKTLAADRDWSLDQMAANLEPGDAELAAHLRSLDTPDRSEAPKGRRSRKAGETAAPDKD